MGKSRGGLWLLVGVVARALAVLGLYTWVQHDRFLSASAQIGDAFGSLGAVAVIVAVGSLLYQRKQLEGAERARTAELAISRSHALSDAYTRWLTAVGNLKQGVCTLHRQRRC
jgi:hypothetical protein